MLSEKERKLLKELAIGKITKEQYSKECPLVRDYTEFVELLLSTLTNDENEYNSLFHSIFWFLPRKIDYEQEKEMFMHFLLIKGHNEHEEIAQSFQNEWNKDMENIPVLLKAIEDVPYYIERIDKYPYIRKLIYAIGAQPEPYNIYALEKLTRSEDKELVALALHQIDKRNPTKKMFDLLFDYSISEDEFYRKFPYRIDDDFILSFLEFAYETKDARLIENMFRIAAKVSKCEKLIPMFRKLIKETWHNAHEDLAMFFESTVRDIDCVDDIVAAMHIKCDYWYDDGDAFIRKCAYVLGNLATDYSIQKLHELSNDNDAIISKYAKYQLDRIAK